MKSYASCASGIIGLSAEVTNGSWKVWLCLGAALIQLLEKATMNLNHFLGLYLNKPIFRLIFMSTMKFLLRE